MDGRKALNLGGLGAFFMRSCPALPGLFSRSDFAAVTGKSLAPQRKKIPVDNPKIVNPGFNLPRTRFFLRVLDTKHFGRLFARFPGERNKTYVILLRSLGLLIDHFPVALPNATKSTLLFRSPI